MIELAVRFCARKLIYRFLNPLPTPPCCWIPKRSKRMGSVWRRWRCIFNYPRKEVSRDFGRYQEGREMVYHLVLVAGAWPTLDTQNLFVFVVRSSLSRPRGERRNLGPLSLHQNELTTPLLFPFFSREIERRKDKLELKPNG